MSFFGKQFTESHIQPPGPMHTDPSTPLEEDSSNGSSHRDDETSTSASSSQKSRYLLDLRHNDTSFLVISKLILNLFAEPLESGATSIELTLTDRRHLDRMVDDRLRPSLVDAVCHRLESCPESSDLPIHTAVRKCAALGINRRGTKAAQNILYATPGTIIPINVSIMHLHRLFLLEFLYYIERQLIQSLLSFSIHVSDTTNKLKTQQSPPPLTIGANRTSIDEPSVLTGANETINPENFSEALARRQLLAELQEANTMIKESVTPEARNFWRNHAAELQARLRALQGDDPQLDGLATEYGLKPNGDPLSQDAASQDIEEATGYQSMNDTTTQEERLVEVVAPSDLPAGYMFEAEIDQRRFLATVPAGGVRQGETFSCYMRELDHENEEVPIGRWKNAITDCFAYGMMHPLVWNSLFCPLLAVGQILTRGGFDFLGRPVDMKEPYQTAFSNMFSIVTFWLLLNSFIFAAFNYKWYKGLELSTADYYAVGVVNVVMFLFTIFSTYRARSAIREKYMIMGPRYGLDNCLCATFCLPCSICQMGYHTAAFDEHGAACCTETGLPQEMDQVFTTVGSTEASPAPSGGEPYLV